MSNVLAQGDFKMEQTKENKKMTGCMEVFVDSELIHPVICSHCGNPLLCKSCGKTIYQSVKEDNIIICKHCGKPINETRLIGFSLICPLCGKPQNGQNHAKI